MQSESFKEDWTPDIKTLTSGSKTSGGEDNVSVYNSLVATRAYVKSLVIRTGLTIEQLAKTVFGLW